MSNSGGVGVFVDSFATVAALFALAGYLKVPPDMNAPGVEADHYREFMGLYSAHARRLYAYTMTLVPNWADADDVFQESSRVLWEKFDQFQAGSDFVAWSCRIVHFQALSFRQRQQRSRLKFSPEFLDAVSLQAAADTDLLEKQHHALADCLQKLTPRARKLVQLRWQPAATTKSVADQVGSSVEAVYKALNRAQRLLVECVERAVNRGEESS